MGSRLPRGGAEAGTLRAAAARRYRRLLLLVCLMLGCATVVLLAGGQMNESASDSVRFMVVSIALTLIAGSWVALRRGRAPGFFAFLLVHLLAAHITLTWLAFQTSGRSAMIFGTRIEYGGWWLSGIISLMLGAIFLIGTRRGYRERARVLFGSAASHLTGPEGARLHRAAATLTGCTFVLFFVSATGLLKIEMLVNPAVSSLFLFFLVVLIYGCVRVCRPSRNEGLRSARGGVFLLVGGVQRYKYPIRYPDHVATSSEIDSKAPVMDYSAPLDLERQLAYEREQQQGGMNEVARLATQEAFKLSLPLEFNWINEFARLASLEGGSDADGRIGYPQARLKELREIREIRPASAIDPIEAFHAGSEVDVRLHPGVSRPAAGTIRDDSPPSLEVRIRGASPRGLECRQGGTCSAGDRRRQRRCDACGRVDALDTFGTGTAVCGTRDRLPLTRPHDRRCFWRDARRGSLCRHASGSRRSRQPGQPEGDARRRIPDARERQSDAAHEPDGLR